MSVQPDIEGPHQGQHIYTAGASLSEAQGAIILLHGRGAGARDIAPLAQELYFQKFAYFFPQAAGNTWYPQRFMAPVEQNQPWLDSALSVMEGLVDEILSNSIPANNIFLGGFSQGACLAAEYAARYPRRWGGVLILSGGLIGPSGQQYPYSGSFEGTPVLIGCSDADPHIPLSRVQETSAKFAEMGAKVTELIIPDLGHNIAPEEIELAREIIERSIPAQ